MQQNELLRDHEIEFVYPALAGYKQSQQLLLVSYLLTQGVEFDLVIRERHLEVASGVDGSPLVKTRG